MQRGRARGSSLVDDRSLGRRVVEHEHDVREQPVPATKIDDTTATEQPSRSPCDLPGLIQLLPRQATGDADGTANAVKQRCAAESPQVVRGEPPTRRVRKRHGRCYPFMMNP